MSFKNQLRSGRDSPAQWSRGLGAEFSLALTTLSALQKGALQICIFSLLSISRKRGKHTEPKRISSSTLARQCLTGSQASKLSHWTRRQFRQQLVRLRRNRTAVRRSDSVHGEVDGVCRETCVCMGGVYISGKEIEYDLVANSFDTCTPPFFWT